ncbi:YraN family protein [Microbulbifer sediminum]|uniref:YraN family protein n=1 Tax=Microbulbifer sediminum TaxID=2904250 RepID=UPI001F02AD99
MSFFRRSDSPGSVGSRMEARAAQFLQRAGLRIATRNFRSRRGEIDLVAWDGDTLVFVEVRFRRNSRFGSAGASVDRRKQTKLVSAAESYLQAHKLDCPCRFDVVAIEGDDGQIEWITGAFAGET